MVCATNKASDQSLCWSLEFSMTVKQLTEHHLEFLSLKEGCKDSSESTLVKMSHCWKSHVAAHTLLTLSNELRKRDIKRGFTGIVLLFRNKLKKFY